ncbi:MAG TPA: peroxidase-related enzyme [Ohtaekwangia sp.]|uniref:carboxymuconolactone decarboxylase family protein n=1 Tax=Ohtaekwangia sp. TaxID=2066019 RepID=UPI002F92C86E
MPHIQVPEGVPGIRSLVMFRPETGQYLYKLAQVLLREESPLTPAERELIATHVSARNACVFCMSSHAAAARELYKEDRAIVDCVIRDGDAAPVTPKMKALLVIAGHVQQNGKNVTEADIAAARAEGATDRDIHDTVLIAAAFSMFNRYVDGLASFTPTDPKEYDAMGVRLAAVGYTLPKPVSA